MESSAQRNTNEGRKVTPTLQTTSNNVEVLNDDDCDSCGCISNLFEIKRVKYGYFRTVCRRV